MTENIFDGYLSRKTLFVNKEFLRHNYNPSKLPHRKNEIDTLSFNLVEALKGHIPSNMTLYGVTGAGKTAVTNYVCSQLEEKGKQLKPFCSDSYSKLSANRHSISCVKPHW